MSTAKVLSFGENRSGMTIADGLDFIERTRRQLNRYDDAISPVNSMTISTLDRDRIRALCDKVEAEINELLGIR